MSRSEYDLAKSEDPRWELEVKKELLGGGNDDFLEKALGDLGVLQESPRRQEAQGEGKGFGSDRLRELWEYKKRQLTLEKMMELETRNKIEESPESYLKPPAFQPMPMDVPPIDRESGRGWDYTSPATGSEQLPPAFQPMPMDVPPISRESGGGWDYTSPGTGNKNQALGGKNGRQ